MFQLDIHTLLVFLEDKSILFRPDFLLHFRGKTKKLHDVGISCFGRFKEALDCTQFADKLIAMQLGKVARAIRRRGRRRYAIIRHGRAGARPSLFVRHRLASKGNDTKRGNHNSPEAHRVVPLFLHVKERTTSRRLQKAGCIPPRAPH